MEEKELKKLIEEQSEAMEIPAALEPEIVVQKLEEKAHKRRMAYYRKLIAAAACCTVIAGAGAVGAMGMFGDNGGEENGELASGTKHEASRSTGESTADIAMAQDYDEIYRYIQEESERQSNAYAGSKGAAMTMEAKTEAAADSAAGAAESSGTAAYSDTNIREEGVGEADIVKTDGERLFVLNNHTIHIVDITQPDMEEVGSIELETEAYVAELYVKDDRLVAVYTQSEKQEEAADSSVMYSYKESAVAETFDIGDPAKPESIGKISQSGSYHTMRVSEDKVYLFSDYYPDMGCARSDIASYVPSVQGKVLESGDIFMPPLGRGSKYTVISSFSLNEPAEKTDSKAVFGDAGMCYVSGENIYICESDYDYADTDVNQTCIRKISYKDGKLKAVGQTKLDGILNDSFSIDEYKGNLRLVTSVSYQSDNGIMPISLFKDKETEGETDAKTVKKDYNALYILDENLKELSRIENLAPEEQVYSARFMGDTGYFVTFRQTDPLFSADLSDPEKPVILGELKIPGFSEYLHPYGDGLLLGIGMDVDESGTVTNGVKLSMFDISDPKEVKETQKYVIEDTYSTDVAYNYKAVYIDREKGLIGFAAYGDTQMYYIFSYGKDGFTKVFERELTGFASNVRALHAENRLYLVAGNTVESYELATFEKTDDIVL